MFGLAKFPQTCISNILMYFQYIYQIIDIIKLSTRFLKRVVAIATKRVHFNRNIDIQTSFTQHFSEYH